MPLGDSKSDKEIFVHFFQTLKSVKESKVLSINDAKPLDRILRKTDGNLF